MQNTIMYLDKELEGSEFHQCTLADNSLFKDEQPESCRFFFVFLSSKLYNKDYP